MLQAVRNDLLAYGRHSIGNAVEDFSQSLSGAQRAPLAKSDQVRCRGPLICTVQSQSHSIPWHVNSCGYEIVNW